MAQNFATPERLAQLGQMNTSGLIALMTNESVLMAWILGDRWEPALADIVAMDPAVAKHSATGAVPVDLTDNAVEGLVRPLLLAIAAEIDRRIPVPA